MSALTDTDRELLDAWGLTWRYPGRRDSILLARTGLTPARQAQRLNRLIDSREALEYAPMTVRRLQRMRARQQRYGRVR